MKRVAVVGSRTFTDYDLLCKTLDGVVSDGDEIVSGGAFGADKLAEQYAKSRNLNTIIYYPDWDTYGKSAGYLRNQQIVKDCDVLVAFWLNNSRGTKHSIDLARKAGKEVHIITTT
jgi:GH18 family chitinase